MTRQERVLLTGGDPRERFEILCTVVTSERTRMLLELSYEAFLRTGYWRIISTYLKVTRGACERCGMRRGLQAHHKSYAHHGREHEHLADLLVLCRSCHEREHNLPVRRDGWVGAGELLPHVMRSVAQARGPV